MNEPQTWTAIGILGTALFAMLTLVSTLFLRIMQAEFRAVRFEIGSLRSEIGHLDRDVQSIAKRVFGDDAA